MTARRLIGIDLAWSERNKTGCAELVRDGDDLTLTRLDTCGSIDDIAKWIEPERGDWVVAVDAPLVVHNRTGSRAADRQATHYYGRYEAGAYPTNLKLLGVDHRGGQLLNKLEERGGKVVEAAADAKGKRLVFETYPHIVMVELFCLDRTIKYKKGKVACRRYGQQQLAKAIENHLCAEGTKKPRLLSNHALDNLLCKPKPDLRGRNLKHREDKLDALICAYTAAWLDAGRPIQGLGEPRHGVMLTPHLRHITPRLV